MSQLTLTQCYQLLEVQADASIEAVKLAYRQLAKVWHPDRFVEDPELCKIAEAKLKQINAAYQQIREHLTQIGTQPVTNQPPQAPSPATTQGTTARANRVRVSSRPGPARSPAQIFYGYAIDCMARGSYTAAQNYLNDAIRLEPDYLAAYELRYEVARRKGSDYLARQDWQKIQELQRNQKARQKSSARPPAPPATNTPESMVDRFSTIRGPILNHQGPVIAMALEASGLRLGTIGHDRWLQVQGLDAAANGSQSRQFEAELTALAVSRDGYLWAIGSANGVIWIWDGRRQRVGATLDERWLNFGAGINALRFAPDGFGLWSVDTQGTVCHWDLKAGRSTLRWSAIELQRSSEVPAPQGSDLNAVMSACGRAALLGGQSCGLQLLDLQQSKIQRRWSLSQPVNALAWSPDRRAIALAQGATIQLSLASPKPTTRLLQGHQGPVRAIAFAPHSTWFLSTGDDGTLQFWNLSTDRPLKTLSLPAPGRALVTDGKRIFCGLETGAVMLIGE